VRKYKNMNENGKRENSNSFFILATNIRIEVKNQQRKDFQKDDSIKINLSLFSFCFLSSIHIKVSISECQGGI
jgi:hypothetical protein